MLCTTAASLPFVKTGCKAIPTLMCTCKSTYIHKSQYSCLYHNMSNFIYAFAALTREMFAAAHIIRAMRRLAAGPHLLVCQRVQQEDAISAVQVLQAPGVVQRISKVRRLDVHGSVEPGAQLSQQCDCHLCKPKQAELLLRVSQVARCCLKQPFTTQVGTNRQRA